jgi:hypothetical protein
VGVQLIHSIPRPDYSRSDDAYSVPNERRSPGSGECAEPRRSFEKVTDASVKVSGGYGNTERSTSSGAPIAGCETIAAEGLTA